MNIAAGDLNKRIEFQSPFHAQDDDGADTVTWIPEFKSWASIKPLSVREFIQSATEQVQVTARIAVRFNARIKSNWRIVHNDTIYYIVGGLPDAWVGTDYLTLAVNTGVNQG